MLISAITLMKQKDKGPHSGAGAAGTATVALFTNTTNPPFGQAEKTNRLPLEGIPASSVELLTTSMKHASSKDSA